MQTLCDIRTEDFGRLITYTQNSRCRQNPSSQRLDFQTLPVRRVRGILLCQRLLHDMHALIAVLRSVCIALAPFRQLAAHKGVVHQTIIDGWFLLPWPDALEAFDVTVRTVLEVLVPPVAWSEPVEERTQGWHAGGDQGEVVLNAAVR